EDDLAGVGPGDQPVEVEEIAVGSLEPLPTLRGPPPIAEQRPPERLEMSAPVPEGRPVGGGAPGVAHVRVADRRLLLVGPSAAGAQTWPPHSPPAADTRLLLVGASAAGAQTWPPHSPPARTLVYFLWTPQLRG